MWLGGGDPSNQASIPRQLAHSCSPAAPTLHLASSFASPSDTSPALTSPAPTHPASSDTPRQLRGLARNISDASPARRLTAAPRASSDASRASRARLASSARQLRRLASSSTPRQLRDSSPALTPRQLRRLASSELRRLARHSSDACRLASSGSDASPAPTPRAASRQLRAAFRSEARTVCSGHWDFFGQPPRIYQLTGLFQSILPLFRFSKRARPSG